MSVGTRKYSRHIKSLMHFDYPYFAEAGDGCRDEIKKLSWSVEGEAIFVGTQIPVAPNNTLTAGTPKFGWRCLQTAADTDYIKSAVTGGYLDINTAKAFEFECFVRKTASSAGRIFSMHDSNDANVFQIGTDASDMITVTSSVLSLNAVSTSGLQLSDWQHVRVRINEGALEVYIAGIQVYTGTVSGSVTDVSEVRLGGFPGQIDEFMLKDMVGEDTVPTEPYRGKINIYGVGGDGHNGILNLQTGTNYINTTYMIQAIQDKSTFTVKSLTQATNSVGLHGQAQAGDELMIIKHQKVNQNLEPSEQGKYAFVKVRSVTSTTFTLEEEVSGITFTNDELTNYAIEAVLIPNYETVTIGSSAIVRPIYYSTYYGGIVAFRCKGDVTIDGTVRTLSYGPDRYGDYYQMTHFDLPERFIVNHGGGVMILSEGKVSIADTAHVGGTWDGSKLAGTGGSSGGYNSGGNGGSGYGGGGAAWYMGTNYGGGAAGGVGGGGGSASTGKSGGVGSGHKPGVRSTMNAGTTQPTGGNNYYWGSGGIQGQWRHTDGPGQCSTYSNTSAQNSPSSRGGASVMILCKVLDVSMVALCTGGAGGTSNSGGTSYSSGTGFCYLAYEEAI